MYRFYISIFIIFLTTFAGCNFKAGYNSQSDINVRNQKESNTSELSELRSQGVINDAEYKLILDCLTADCDVFLQRGTTLPCQEIKDMAMNTLRKLEHIKMTESLISIIMKSYSVIAASNQVRNILQIGEYCNPNLEIWEWHRARQTISDRLDIVHRKVKLMVDNAATNKNITFKEIDEIATEISADIAKVEADTLLAEDQLRDIVKAGLDRYSNRGLDNNVVESISNVYHSLADVKKVEMKEEFDLFFKENITQPEPLEYKELKKYVQTRVDWMLEESLIGADDHKLLSTTMQDDIDTFLKGSQSKDELEKRAKKSLDKLKNITAETEDREFIAETYYDIAQRNDLDIGAILNTWMYDSDF